MKEMGSWVLWFRGPAQCQTGTAAGTLGAGSDPLPNAAKSVASPALVGNEDCCLVLLWFLAAVWSCWFLSGAQRCCLFFLSEQELQHGREVLLF